MAAAAGTHAAPGLCERAAQIVHQHAGNGRPARGLTADHDEVHVADRMVAQPKPGGFLQPAAGAVAHHGVADLLGDGEADARNPTGPGARQRLQHEAGHGCFAAGLGNAQELGPALEPDRGRIMGGRRLVRAPWVKPLGRELLAADPAPVGNDLAAANGRHAGAEAMPALADQLRGLIGALHDEILQQRGGALAYAAPYPRGRLIVGCPSPPSIHEHRAPAGRPACFDPPGGSPLNRPKTYFLSPAAEASEWTAYMLSATLAACRARGRTSRT